MQSYVVPLTPDQTSAVELVGGKAYNLLRLISAGMPVPGGFVIATTAYRRWISAGRTWPSDLSDQIQKAYAQLGADCQVAVRSSGISEDMSDASFAGGHETLLSISGWADLQSAIERCWESLEGDRVRAYRSKMGVSEDGLSIAVVIQHMVRARVSGVIFTREPVSGDPDIVALDACAGLGEDLVSGHLIPEHYELRRNGLSLVKLENKAGYLSKKQVRKIALCALEIERHFGCPQDIEWSLDQKSDLKILQSRPITCISAARWANPVNAAVWVRRGAGGLAEYLPTAITPFYTTSQLPKIMDLHEVLCSEMGVSSPSPSMALINGHFYSRQDYKLGFRSFALPVNYWRAGREAAPKWRAAIPEQSAMLAKLQDFDYALATDSELIAQINRLLDFNAQAWDHAARAARAWEVGEPVFKRIFHSFIKPKAGGDPVTFLRGFDSQTLAAEQGQIDLVESAKQSTTIGRILNCYADDEALVKLQETEEGSQWVDRLIAFCSRFGHVTPNQDFYWASPADDPAKALGAIRSRLDLAPSAKSSNPLQRQLDVTAERKRAEAETFQKLHSSPLRSNLFRWALVWAQEGASIREDVFFSARAGWPFARRLVLEMGSRLVWRELLASPEDVFFLTWDEVRKTSAPSRPGQLREVVAGRRAEFLRQLDLVAPPMVPISGPPPTATSRIKAVLKRAITGSSRRAARPNAKDELYGSAVSPGRVTGPARILASAADAGRLRPGDIVVTRAATPDWTPTFSIAAGLVTDTGGPLSHCSIVAREFGIPAVMGVPTATQRISEGQIITVDGAEGVIRLHTLPEVSGATA